MADWRLDGSVALRGRQAAIALERGGAQHRDMLKCAAIVIAVSAIASARPARACMAAEMQRALIHNQAPDPLPRHSIVAQVEFGYAPEDSLYKNGLRATVFKWLRGGSGREIILLNTVMSSCDSPFKNGTHGIIVGRKRGMRGNVIVAEAFLVSRASGYRGRYGRAVESFTASQKAIHKKAKRRSETMRDQLTL